MGDEKNSGSGEITKANPCVPNPKAYWCSKCKAHNRSDYSVSYSYNSDGRRTAYEKMGCQVCGASMFCPAETMPLDVWVVRFYPNTPCSWLVLSSRCRWYIGVQYWLGGFLWADRRNDDISHEKVVYLVPSPKEEIPRTTRDGS